MTEISSTGSEDKDKPIRPEDSVKDGGPGSVFSDEGMEHFLDDFFDGRNADSVDPPEDQYDDFDFEEGEKLPPLERIANSAKLLMHLDYMVRTGESPESVEDYAFTAMMAGEEEFTDNLEDLVIHWILDLKEFREETQDFLKAAAVDHGQAVEKLFEKYHRDLLFDPEDAEVRVGDYGIIFIVQPEDYEEYDLMLFGKKDISHGVHLVSTPIALVKNDRMTVDNPLAKNIQPTIVHENEHIIRGGLFSPDVWPSDQIEEINAEIGSASLEQLEQMTLELADSFEINIKGEICAGLSESKKLNPNLDVEHRLLEGIYGRGIPMSDDRKTFRSAISLFYKFRKMVAENIKFSEDNPVHMQRKRYLNKILDRLAELIVKIIADLNSGAITLENQDQVLACTLLTPVKNYQMIGRVLELVPSHSEKENQELKKAQNKILEGTLLTTPKSLENSRRELNSATQTFEYENETERQFFEAAQACLEAIRRKVTPENADGRTAAIEAYQAASSQMTADRALVLLERAKQEVYDLPESMFMLKEAFARFEKHISKYQFHCGDGAEISRIARSLPENKNYTDLAGKHADRVMRYGVAVADGQIVGETKYKDQPGGVLTIEYQNAQAAYPGVGLGMLQEISEMARTQGYKFIRLTTTRTPLGLGNLGFEPYTYKENPEIIAYQLALSPDSASGQSDVGAVDS